jgi:hypothetical protein
MSAASSWCTNSCSSARLRMGECHSSFLTRIAASTRGTPWMFAAQPAGHDQQQSQCAELARLTCSDHN